jgi:hypothetical protein
MARTRTQNQDPITERSRSLSAEIAALEQQIRELGGQLDQARSGDSSATVTPKSRPARAAEPVFEALGNPRVRGANAPETDRSQYNELGVRKLDLTGLWRRARNPMRRAQPTNPRLINYLAAGSIQGLRPLRYEKRVARNRVLALALLLFFVLWGLFAMFYR